ncbi:MAG: hypothetical protein DMF88_13740 [Acidobacteria bacterium]|nr:MAG: hypothetical protein DMF88_13740 [Acidobacteriota bacterium]
MTVAYNVYLAGTSTSLAGTLDTSVTFTGLGNGVTQSYQVVGVNPNPAGEGPRSAVVTATTVHCSQNCAACCTGETCSSVPTTSNGCQINGAACGPPCPANLDVCRNGFCACHQYDWQVCDTTIGQADYMKTCGTYNNACGQPVSCGTCPPYPNYYCTGGISAHCACTAWTAAQACGGACGTTAPDGCGGSVTCPACPPPGGGGGCFAAGTGVTMADGSVKPIEDVAAGDEVLSYDVETAAVVPGVVTRTFAHPATPALLRINGTLATTPEHRFLVNGRWIAAGKLRVGDGLLRQECAAGSCQSGDAARVESIEVLRGEATTDAAALMSPKILSSELATDVAGVASLQTLSGQETSYNLEVAPYQTYFVEGVVVSTLKQ